VQLGWSYGQLYLQRDGAVRCHRYMYQCASAGQYRVPVSRSIDHGQSFHPYICGPIVRRLSAAMPCRLYLSSVQCDID